MRPSSRRELRGAASPPRRQARRRGHPSHGGYKVDLIVRKARPFSVEEFCRREPAELFGARVFVATAEDSILAKLEWAKLGDSERQIRDVSGILEVRAGALDRDYIEKWAAALGLTEEWRRIQDLTR